MTNTQELTALMAATIYASRAKSSEQDAVQAAREIIAEVQRAPPDEADTDVVEPV